MATILYGRGRPATHLVHKFLEHFAQISDALKTQGLWDETDGFFYDRLRLPDGSTASIKVRSIVGIVPLLGVVDIDADVLDRAEQVDDRIVELLTARQEDVERLQAAGLIEDAPDDRDILLGVVEIDRVLRIFTRLFNEEAFLSPARPPGALPLPRRPSLRAQRRGLAGLDRLRARGVDHRHVRRQLELAGTDLVSGQLPRRRRARPLRTILRRSTHDRVPDRLGTRLTITEIADDLRRRLISIFLVGPDGRRPCFGGTERFQTDPGLEGQHPLQRVLPRRQRCGARGHAPDRLDGPCRRPDPPGARAGAADALRADAAVGADATARARTERLAPCRRSPSIPACRTRCTSGRSRSLRSPTSPTDVA